MIGETISDILATLFVIGGLFFLLVGAVGIVRFPDTYNRLHASSKCSTLGLLGLILGVIFHIGTLAVATKGLLTILFAFVATPVGSHILAKAAHIDNAPLWGGTLSDELAEDYPDMINTAEDDGNGNGNGDLSLDKLGNKSACDKNDTNGNEPESQDGMPVTSVTY